LNALSAAASSDSNISAIFREIQPDIAILSSGETSLREIARKVAAGKVASGPDPSISLLDLDEEVGSKSGLEDNEKEELKRATGDARDRLDRLSKIRRERDEVLKDLKEKVGQGSSCETTDTSPDSKRRCFIPSSAKSSVR
jgi:hypothetical protein